MRCVAAARVLLCAGALVVLLALWVQIGYPRIGYPSYPTGVPAGEMHSRREHARRGEPSCALSLDPALAALVPVARCGSARIALAG